MKQPTIEVAADLAQSQLKTLVRERQLQAGAVLKIIDSPKGDEYLVYNPFDSLPFRRAQSKDHVSSILLEINTQQFLLFARRNGQSPGSTKKAA